MTFHCLTQLYKPGGLLIDGDGDGLPDGLCARVSAARNPGAIDVAARLGLESAALTPGFTRPETDGVPVWFGPGNSESPAVSVPDGCGLITLAEGGLVITGSDPEQGWQAARWLAETFPFVTPGGPLLSEWAGGRTVTGVILRDGKVIDLRRDEAAPMSGADKPCRDLTESADETGSETAAETAPGDLPPPGLARLWSPAGLLRSSDGVRHDRAGWQVQITDQITAAEIAALCELAARTGVEAQGLYFPLAVSTPPEGIAIHLSNQQPAAEWVENGLAWEPGSLTAFGSAAERAAALSAAAATGMVDGVHATLFTRRAALPPEPVERGEPVLDFVLEQEWEVDRFRRLWRDEVLPALVPGAAVSVDLRLSEPLPVREALAEEIAAALADRGVPEARIRVLSAYKQGFHWLEEEVLPRLQGLGALERVHIDCARFAPADAADPAPERRALELPIRWLQELYPIDELLGRALGVPVTVELTEAPQPEIYRVTAFHADGSEAYREGFSPVHAARPYLPEFPARGRVHPPTGLLRAEQGGRLLAEAALDTDLEAFWTAYQEQVLPRLRAWVTQQHGAGPGPDAQPFFGALVAEVALSEDDRRLGIGEEQISPLDALHEELYFDTLDYFREWGLAADGQAYEFPGAIEPWIRGRAGGPQARIRLFPAPPVTLTGLVAERLPGRAAELPAPAADLPLDRVIGPDQLPAHLAHLARLRGVQVWRAGLSYGGRPTWALAVTAPTAGRIAPPQKLSAWRPTLLVNARRHANEVSATNSALALAAEVARNASLRRRINLVICPMENVDGAALHYAMQQEHPFWKLHAARFNAVGTEIGRYSFDPEPRFGEARTLPTLWRAFLPDLIFDDHGVPSHEWVQPFAGYNSAPGRWQQSWWIPSALFFSIHYEADHAQGSAVGRVQEALRDVLAGRMMADAEIQGYTEVLLQRYRRYGQRYLPGQFPLHTHLGYFCQITRASGGLGRFSFSFPQITAATVTTEVPDETAQGDYLALCARAHLQANRAAIDLLTAREQPVVRTRHDDGHRVLWTVARQRPLQV